MSTEVDVDHVIAHLRSHYPRAKYVGTDDSKLGINRQDTDQMAPPAKTAGAVLAEMATDTSFLTPRCAPVCTGYLQGECKDVDEPSARPNMCPAASAI